jgi:hypothetical protein
MGVLFQTSSRRLLAQFEQVQHASCQQRILRGLLHRAQSTQFGRSHDFLRIRDVYDFRRLVPLRTPEELARDCWHPTFPELGGTTWPRPVPHLVLPTHTGLTPPWAVALSPQLQAAHRQAWRTSLALVSQARPRVTLQKGTLLFLNEGRLTPTEENLLPVREIAWQRLPFLVQPCALTAPADEDLLGPLTAHALRRSLTVLAGPADILERFLEGVLCRTGRESAVEVWPELVAVLPSRRAASHSLDRLRELVGPGVLFLEMLAHPAGIIAIEDPRHGMLRLLTNHGLFFEFIRPEEGHKPNPPRFGLAELEPGTPYELVLTSPAGWWACRMGITLAFSASNRSLCHLDEIHRDERVTARPLISAASRGEPLPAPWPPPHPRSDGTPGGQPETFFHTLWSTPWGRG